VLKISDTGMLINSLLCIYGTCMDSGTEVCIYIQVHMTGTSMAICMMV